MQEMQEKQVQFLCQEDPLEKEMTALSNILAQKIPGTEEPGGLQSMYSQKVGWNWAHTHTVPKIIKYPLYLKFVLFFKQGNK